MSTLTKITAATVVVVAVATVGLVLFFSLLAGASVCSAGAGAALPELPPAESAREGIPSNYLALYQQAGRNYAVPWPVLAAIGFVETNHGRSTAPGVTSGQNFHGCCAGPMQFHNDYGTGGGTWGAYAVDGNRDGTKDIYDPEDAIPTAGRYLKASGAPAELDRAIFAYNHDSAYVAKVKAQAAVYAGQRADQLAATPNGVPSSEPDRSILVLGDSLAVGTSPPLRRELAGWRFQQEAATGRTTAAGIDLLASVRPLPAVVAISLGTNDSPADVAGFRRQVERAMTIVGPERCVVWTTIGRGPVAGRSYAGLNEVLDEAAARHPNLQQVDGTGGDRASDGIHLTPGGYEERAEQIAAAGERCAGTAGLPADGCDEVDGSGVYTGSGNWELAPGANRPGQGLTPEMTSFVDRMAGAYQLLGADHKLVLTTGTNHSQYTTSNNISDHWNGNAGDFGMVANGGTNDGPTGDLVAAAAFMAAGLPRNEAIARGRQGGLETLVRNGLRVQIIWKSSDHHDHVHCGIRRE